MDKEQEEIQYLGFFGIFKESFQIISSWRKIFSQITLAFILPLSFIYEAHIQISEYFFVDISEEEFLLDGTQKGTQVYNQILHVLNSELTWFYLFKLFYFIFFLILTLLSTSAVVYTIACIYTAKDISFKKVLGVVPKVWKRLMVTFIWNFIIFFVYNMVSFMIIMLWLILSYVMTGNLGDIGAVVLFVLLIAYTVGFLYITVIWHLASVVSVLEDAYGLQAMVKSQGLIKGKLCISVLFVILFGLGLFANQSLFTNLFVENYLEGIGYKISYGILCWMLQSIWMLLALIIQTIIYFVCKSYHHENIDKSMLADHLEVYLGEYVPLKSQDIQLEQFHV